MFGEVILGVMKRDLGTPKKFGPSCMGRICFVAKKSPTGIPTCSEICLRFLLGTDWLVL